MEDLWSDRNAETTIRKYAEAGVGEDLALRVYSSRLLGSDPRLVQHGGGNTSVKTAASELMGGETAVIHVKGSGRDLGSVEPGDFAAIRLGPLQSLTELEDLSDDDMINAGRCNMLGGAAPSPSVEFLSHAFLPPKYIDHGHANAVLSLANQPDGGKLVGEVYGRRVGIVPYIMPGFGLAKKVLRMFEADPGVDGLILLKHGLFTFGETARQSYRRMVELVNMAEARLREGRKSVFAAATIAGEPAKVADVAPILRGLCTPADGAHKRSILDFRTTPEILDYVNGADVRRYSQIGTVTPDHVIRTKPRPLVVAAPRAGGLDDFRHDTAAALADYAKNYRVSLARHVPGAAPADAMPRVTLVPGLGLFGLGTSAAGAAIAADIAATTIDVVTGAEAMGRYESAAEADMFAIEQWSLERAKLGERSGGALAGHVVVVTGGGGVIGAAIVRAFATEGAEVAVLDLDASIAAGVARQAGNGSYGLACDVTEPGSVAAAFDHVCETFGGVDIAVSNAGAAWQGAIGEVSDDLLRRSFELNFWAHQTVAQNAVRVMRRQGIGGCLLFNASKQAVNPGPGFGPYGMPKTATLALMRQYAIDHGAEGIRSNAVNADRIRSGLLSGEMVKERAKARGVSETDYMSGNLLGLEVTAEDVAQAFVYLALAAKTTAAVTTVDGGNIAAALR